MSGVPAGLLTVQLGSLIRAMGLVEGVCMCVQCRCMCVVIVALHIRLKVTIIMRSSFPPDCSSTVGTYIQPCSTPWSDTSLPPLPSFSLSHTHTNRHSHSHKGISSPSLCAFHKLASLPSSSSSSSSSTSSSSYFNFSSNVQHRLDGLFISPVCCHGTHNVCLFYFLCRFM